MTDNEIYNQWKNQKIDIPVGGKFTDNVMSGIHRQEQQRRTGFYNRELLYRLLSRRFVKAALITVGFVGGLLRIASVIGFILGSCMEAKGGLIW
ncbi:MAG: hypothetical protein WC975_01080 [Phycisphaerae bacterium]